MDIAGLRYDPLREQCTLTRDPSVNYLIHLVRVAGPAPAGPRA
jgi:2-polyprenyl-3-methyl-5-hydroxy-6-metoxy-1,4-benzoquinol methylase